MTDLSPLQRAHALSAQATHLLRPNSSSSSQTMHKALDSYRQAAELFHRSAGDVIGDDGAKRTLELLTVQHRKLAKDLERRMGAMVLSGGGASSAGISSSRQAGLVTNSHRRRQLPSLFIAQITWLQVGSILTPWTKPLEVNTSPVVPPLGVPPFSLRPTVPSSAQPQSQVAPPHTASTQALSPLDSSSSSSDAPDESYLHLETLDPFSKFWGALETMLDDISNPVAFASAPLDLLPVNETLQNVRRGSKGKRKDASSQAKGKVKAKDESLSPTESFYLVTDTKKSEQVTNNEPTRRSPASKTSEELALENTSLRMSLDALASHAQALEQANKTLNEASMEREKLMRSVVVGVRREAQKAKVGTDLMRSQLLTSASIPRSAGRPPPGGGGSGVMPDQEAQPSTGLRTRIHELEEEVRKLKVEHEKQKGQIAKYKDRFDKLKISARAKKEAKLVSTISAEEGG
ncbi:MAG: hypothetical protein TREMPRED_001591 [Tremellales sp. Tagirdzhanova-0007]|nr:MAG: hypothetical protein TREMPRED_001591 [Tremellales sp. Tagirdzhanova-0007]